MSARFEFKREDCWVGVFWRRERWWREYRDYLMPPGEWATHIWICLVPMFPLHITLNPRPSSTSESEG